MSWGSPLSRRTSCIMSSLSKLSPSCSITFSLIFAGGSGLKIVGRPRVEIANPFATRDWRTLYADVRGMCAVSAIISALPWPWATSAMYPVASELEMYGVGGLVGGGHVTWTLTGDQANILRTKVLQMFDDYPVEPAGFAYAHLSSSPLLGAVSIRSGRLESGEAEMYTNFLE